MRRLLAILIAPFVLSACGGGTPTTPTPQPQAAVPCTNIVLSSGTINQSAGGGATSITVTPTPANCTWTVVSNNAFLRITSAATVTGPGSFTFTTDPNTGAGQRTGNVAVGAAFVLVTQLGTAPPITWAPAAPPNGVVNVAYRHDFGGARGGVEPLTYFLDSGGFPPNGLILSPAGILAGVPTAPTPLGGLPAHFPWTGTFRRTNGRLELFLTVPSLGIRDEAWPATLNGTALTITIEFDSIYTFRGVLSESTNVINNGTFDGGNCHLASTPVLPQGTWTGIRR